MEDKVYMAGYAENQRGVLQYNKREDKWSDMPRCTVSFFGLASYKNRLITVGGLDLDLSIWSGVKHFFGKCLQPTNRVFTLSADSQKWEELIPPMPTARCALSVITTATAIIAAGGVESVHDGAYHNPTTTVEVYNDNTSQWYTAEPLPARPRFMSSVVMTNDDVFYLEGGNFRYDDCYRASLSSLIQRATSPTSPSATSSESLWKTLSPTPLNDCSMVCLNGSLLAVGREWSEDDSAHAPSAVYIFLNNEWVKLTNADLPAAKSWCGAAQLSSDEIILVERGLSVYIGTLLQD